MFCLHEDQQISDICQVQRLFEFGGPEGFLKFHSASVLGWHPDREDILNQKKLKLQDIHKLAELPYRFEI